MNSKEKLIAVQNFFFVMLMRHNHKKIIYKQHKVKLKWYGNQFPWQITTWIKNILKMHRMDIIPACNSFPANTWHTS